MLRGKNTFVESVRVKDHLFNIRFWVMLEGHVRMSLDYHRIEWVMVMECRIYVQLLVLELEVQLGQLQHNLNHNLMRYLRERERSD